MSFKHITADDRIVIGTLLDEEQTYSYIARRLGVHRSTVGREIHKNQIKPKPQALIIPTRPKLLDIDCRHKRGTGLAQEKYEAARNYAKQASEARYQNQFYVARAATKQAVGRRASANKLRTRLVHRSNSWLENYVKHRLIKDQWSPQQISGRLSKGYNLTISVQTIYDYIYLSPDKKRLVQHLRYAGNPYRHKRGTNARIKNRQANLPSIHDREPVIEQRARLGDLEGDTVVGLDTKDRLLTHVDRASGECSLGIVLGYNARKIADQTIRTLKHHQPTHTITYDRGTEFAEYERLQNRINTKVYFADPYSSYQRGSNENLNGLLRQYYPKRTSFKDITPRKLKVVERKLNNRPRKRYNYRTPIEQREYLLGLL